MKWEVELQLLSLVARSSVSFQMLSRGEHAIGAVSENETLTWSFTLTEWRL